MWFDAKLDHLKPNLCARISNKWLQISLQNHKIYPFKMCSYLVGLFVEILQKCHCTFCHCKLHLCCGCKQWALTAHNHSYLRLLHRLIHPTEQVSCDYSIPHKVTEPYTGNSILKLMFFLINSIRYHFIWRLWAVCHSPTRKRKTLQNNNHWNVSHISGNHWRSLLPAIYFNLL